jgi:uncharacterized protein (DUF433 family)
VSTAHKLVPADYIEATASVCGGKPRIAGTRMKVSQVASEHERHGLTPDQIVDAYPHLTMAGVHAALAYYYDHLDEIRREWHDGEEFVTSMKAEYAALTAGRRPNP